MKISQLLCLVSVVLSLITSSLCRPTENNILAGQPTHFHMEDRGPEIQVVADATGVKINAQPAALDVEAKPGRAAPMPAYPGTLAHWAQPVNGMVRHFAETAQSFDNALADGVMNIHRLPRTNLHPPLIRHFDEAASISEDGMVSPSSGGKTASAMARSGFADAFHAGDLFNGHPLVDETANLQREFHLPFYPRHLHRHHIPRHHHRHHHRRHNRHHRGNSMNKFYFPTIYWGDKDEEEEGPNDETDPYEYKKSVVTQNISPRDLIPAHALGPSVFPGESWHIRRAALINHPHFDFQHGLEQMNNEWDRYY